MPSKKRGVLCTLIKTRAECFMIERPEKVIPEKKMYNVVYANNI